jgi:hypothetical protein
MRAGPARRRSSMGRSGGRYLWHRCNTEGTSTRPVARKRPNAWGLYDMVGNAWEYCQVGDTSCWVSRGASWTRCPQYRTRQGTMTGPSGGGSRAAFAALRPESQVPPVPLGRRPGLPLHPAQRRQVTASGTTSSQVFRGRSQAVRPPAPLRTASMDVGRGL